MLKKNIAVVANCQGRPLASALERLSKNVNITYISIVHLMKDADKEKFTNALDEADIIICQLVADNYPCEFVRTSYLEENYSSKLVRIVNLYFTAYTPEWAYLRIPSLGVLRGPIGDYHNKLILSGWKKRHTINKCLADMEAPIDLAIHQAEINKSIKSLKEREVRSDIEISDFIEKNYRSNQLFFTFNHPVAILIVEYAKRILIDQGMEYDDSIKDMGGREPLSQFCPIVNSALRLPGAKRKKHVGRAITFGENNIDIGVRHEYTSEELVEVFYSIYDKYSPLVIKHPLYLEL
jgi:hypothetical protein